MSKSAKLSERTSIQFQSDCVDLIQTDPIGDGPEQRITLNLSSIEKLIPFLERYRDKKKPRGPGRPRG